MKKVIASEHWQAKLRPQTKARLLAFKELYEIKTSDDLIVCLLNKAEELERAREEGHAPHRRGDNGNKERPPLTYEYVSSKNNQLRYWTGHHPEEFSWLVGAMESEVEIGPFLWFRP